MFKFQKENQTDKKMEENMPEIFDNDLISQKFKEVNLIVSDILSNLKQQTDQDLNSM